MNKSLNISEPIPFQKMWKLSGLALRSPLSFFLPAELVTAMAVSKRMNNYLGEKEIIKNKMNVNDAMRKWQGEEGKYQYDFKDGYMRRFDMEQICDREYVEEVLEV